MDYRTLGFRECVGEVVRYLSSLEGVESSDPIGARLVSHLSHCASELDPLLQSPATLPFPPWPWSSYPQLSATTPPGSSVTFPSASRRDLPPHTTGALLGYSSPGLRVGHLSTQGAILSPALTQMHRVPSIPGHPHRLQQHSPDGPTIPSPLQTVRPQSSASSNSSPSTAPQQVSFRPFAPMGSPTPARRGVGNSSKSAQGWGTEIGAFWFRYLEELGVYEEQNISGTNCDKCHMCLKGTTSVGHIQMWSQMLLTGWETHNSLVLIFWILKW